MDTSPHTPHLSRSRPSQTGKRTTITDNDIFGIFEPRIQQLAHDHMASQITLDIEIGARAAGDVVYRNHIHIVEAAPMSTRALPRPLRIPVPAISGVPKWIEPDALFALRAWLYVIEADTGSESIEGVIKQKIRAYRETVASCTVDDHFGFDNLTVLFVTTNATRMRNMMAAVASVAKNGRSGMFAFACPPEFGDFRCAPAPDGGMFRLAWERAGYEALSLAPLAVK